jgi:hypothetical protein
MAALDRAMTRSTATDATTIRPSKTEAETLWSALRADRASRDERTARLRAMALAIGA